jgi:hypothetical protein
MKKNNLEMKPVLLASSKPSLVVVKPVIGALGTI